MIRFENILGVKKNQAVENICINHGGNIISKWLNAYGNRYFQVALMCIDVSVFFLLTYVILVNLHPWASFSQT